MMFTATQLSEIQDMIFDLSCQFYVRGQRFFDTYGRAITFVLGVALVISSGEHWVFAEDPPPPSTTPPDFSAIDEATCTLYAFLEGPYGALLTATAGFGAIGGAVFGSYKSAYNFLIVGVGCFIARSLNSMYFGQPSCGEFDVSKAVTEYHHP